MQMQCYTLLLGPIARFVTEVSNSFVYFGPKRDKGVVGTRYRYAYKRPAVGKWNPSS